MKIDRYKIKTKFKKYAPVIIPTLVAGVAIGYAIHVRASNKQYNQMLQKLVGSFLPDERGPLADALFTWRNRGKLEDARKLLEVLVQTGLANSEKLYEMASEISVKPMEGEGWNVEVKNLLAPYLLRQYSPQEFNNGGDIKMILLQLANGNYYEFLEQFG